MTSLPEASDPIASRAEVFLAYLEYFRARLVEIVRSLPPAQVRRSRVPSGWTPIELIRHLTFVELRWLEWGFEGRSVPDPWGDERDERWHVPADESVDDLVNAIEAQGARSRLIVGRHSLDEVGQPGPRWEGAEPPTLERVLFHVLQEYARHVGQLDIVAELAGAPTGE